MQKREKNNKAEATGKQIPQSPGFPGLKKGCCGGLAAHERDDLRVIYL